MLAPILSIQSHVVYGHVGNSAAVFPLQRLGREVWPLMTVQFSSHLGYAGWRGRAFDAAMIDDCMSGLEAIGVLPALRRSLDRLLGKPEIGEAALRALDRIRAANGEAAYACDPVIGDVGPGIYVAAGVGEFFRDRALPLATIATPNAFELEWLTGRTGDAICKPRGGLSPRCAHADRGSSWRRPSSSTIRLPALSTFWRGTKPASGECARRTCRFLSTDPATCSRRCSFIIGLRRMTRAEALSRAASSVYAIVKATLASGSRELTLIAAQDEFTHPSQLFAAEAV